jgi:hypothetical protein
MEYPPLNFEVLLGYLRKGIETLTDPRKPSNAQRYTLMDIVLGAFSAFFMQSESFLEYQRQLRSRRGRDNAQTLFGIFNIPTVAQIRNVLDGIAAASLFPVFGWVYQALKERHYLKSFEILNGQLLVVLDGCEYHSSSKVNCPCCSQRRQKTGKVTYFHTAVLPAIVHPEKKEVISLAPEFIHPQDGHLKQDCEIQAAKRWVTHHANLFAGQGVTLLGDDLYSHQPMLEHCLKHDFNFIFVCLPQSHTTLVEWVEFLAKNEEVKTLHHKRYVNGQGEIWSHRYVNQVPLRGEQPAERVNWLELTVTREKDGEVLYHNSWVTNLFLSPENLPEVAMAGRSRWKTENENHNILKHRGYHLEHNFGHGQQHLSMVLLTLNLLAFLFHTVLAWVDTRYQQARQQRGTRRGFFQDLLSLTKYLLFEDWQHLLEFLLDDSHPLRAPRSANSS